MNASKSFGNDVQTVNTSIVAWEDILLLPSTSTIGRQQLWRKYNVASSDTSHMMRVDSMGLDTHLLLIVIHAYDPLSRGHIISSSAWFELSMHAW